MCFIKYTSYGMPYFTSWDINVFLCFLSLDLPWDLVLVFTKKIKIVHEKYVEDDTREWYCNTSPTLLYKKVNLWGRWHFSALARTPMKDVISEFKLAWRWRCPEIRRDLICRMIVFQDSDFIERLKYEFDPFNGRRYRIDPMEKNQKKVDIILHMDYGMCGRLGMIITIKIVKQNKH